MSSLEPVAEDPLIEQTTQIIIEESFKEEPSPTRRIYYHRDEITTRLINQYGITLHPTPSIIRREEIERSLWAKYAVALIAPPSLLPPPSPSPVR